MRVAIIGYGTAGPAAALNIVRRLGPKWKVDMYDKVMKPSAVGAGIGFQPIGMTALHQLGLLETIEKYGARIDGIQTHTVSGRPILDVAYKRYDTRLYGLGLHRGVLFETLREACAREPQISERFGVEVDELDQSNSGVTLRDATGKALESQPYDLVVLANGANSQLRAKLQIPGFYRPYAYGALFALLPDPMRTFGNHLVQTHDGPGCHTTLGFLPTGMPWGANLGSTDGFVSTLYYNLRQVEHDSYAATGGYLAGNRLQAWKDHCSRLQPRAADLIQHGVTDVQQVAFARYGDGALWRFHSGRIVLLGDASHSMSPQLGQGCNLALVDAEKLVDCLEKKFSKVPLTDAAAEKVHSTAKPASRELKASVSPVTPEEHIPSVLASYTASRWWRVQFYAAQSRLITPFFASKSVTLAFVRNVFLSWACNAPLLSTFIHGILCGAQAPTIINTIPEREWLGFLEGPGSVGNNKSISRNI